MSGNAPGCSFSAVSTRGLEDADFALNMREASCMLELLHQWSSHVPGDATLDTLCLTFSDMHEQFCVMSDRRYEMLTLAKSHDSLNQTDLRAWQVDMQALADEAENMALLMSDHSSFGSQESLILLTQRCCKALREVTAYFGLLVQSNTQHTPESGVVLEEPVSSTLCRLAVNTGVRVSDCPDLEHDGEDRQQSDRAPIFQRQSSFDPDISSTSSKVGKKAAQVQEELNRPEWVSQLRHQDRLAISEAVESLKSRLRSCEAERRGQISLEQVETCMTGLRAVK